MFTVVIPVYNRPESLRKALMSVFAQTFKVFEVIVIDDGSSADIRQVLTDFNDQRLLYIKAPHMGAPVARNLGIAMAKYEWIAFLDSDDRWTSDKLQKMHDFIIANPSFEFVYSGFTYWDEMNNKPTATRIDHPHPKMTERLLTKNTIHGTSLVVIRKNRLLEIDGFDIRLPARQDVDLYVRLSRLMSFGFIPESLCFVSFKAEKRISTNPLNRLRGYVMFYQKYKGWMNFKQRVYTSKRILYFAWQCGEWRTVLRYFLPAIPSILFKFRF